jgi:C_GCAxxG_C_C family probable redox protein
LTNFQPEKRKMTEKNILLEKASKRFLEGYNCAQSVLLTMFEYWNGKNVLIPKIATGFGGGIGRRGSVCGALTGGVMAIGTRFGTNVPSAEKRQQSYKLSQALYRQFELRHGSVFCRELIHYDLSNPEELEKARKTKVFEERCTSYVRTAIEVLLDLCEKSN